MNVRKTLLSLAVVAIVGFLATSAQAAVIASTDFDDSTIGGSSNIKTTLNWTLNGVNDPGDMAALNSSGNPQNLATGNALMQDSFAPFVNTGNGNTFWTTDIALTVAPGFVVTVEDVIFDYIPFNGGQALNVDRESDFIVSLLDPSNNELDSVLVFDTGGSNVVPQQPTLTATFGSPIALNQPGTYTLRIKGGDLFVGDDSANPPLGTKNETGNHTAIDNLSINGNASAIPEPASLALMGLGGLAMLVRRRR